MAQLIRGTTIEVFLNGSWVSVENALVGEPSSTERAGCNIPTFKVGIPKGDQTDWLDKKLRFFGRTFRTVGYPLQGIEANIPLSWHKTLSVEMLNLNGNTAIFEKDSYKKHVFCETYTADGRGIKTVKPSQQQTDSLSVYIYGCCHDDSYRPKVGDIVVPHETDFEFDTSSEKAVSESMAKLREVYPEYAVISSVRRDNLGAVPDYELSAI